MRTNGPNSDVDGFSKIFGGKGDDIINPLRVTFDDENRVVEVGTDVTYNDDNTVDLDANRDFWSLGVRNVEWDGGEGDDIIFAT